MTIKNSVRKCFVLLNCVKMLWNKRRIKHAFYINEIKIKDDILYCYTEDSIKGLSEVGQMLVDSDNYAFAYTLDDGKAYAYLISYKKHGRCCMKT